jgi:hypothetical protein
MRSTFGKKPNDQTPDYHPYYAAGDFNEDGYLDFAIAVKDRVSAANSMDLVVFNGTPKGVVAQESFYSKNALGAGNGIFFYGSQKRGFMIGPFSSEGCGVWPKGKSYRTICNED